MTARVTRRTFLGRSASVVGLAGAWPHQSVDRREAERALSLAEGQRGELVELLEELVSISSPYGSSAAEAQAVVARYLREARYRVQVFEDDPLRLADHPEFMPPGPAGEGVAVNVEGRSETTAAPGLALFAHIDTEATGEGWETDPLTPVLRDGRLYGLGTADDKGGVAAMLVAAKILAERGEPAPRILSLHGKGGGSRGSLPAFERAGKLDAVLYLHPAETGRGLADVKHVVQGALDLTLTVEGWRGEPLEIGSASSARYDEGGDALAACLTALDGLEDTVLRGAEVNVGRLEAGDAVGEVPDRCEAHLRVLFEEPLTARGLLEQMRRQLKGLEDALSSPRGRFRFALDSTGLRTNPASVSWDDPYCLSLREAIESVTGMAPKPHTRHYAGDIRYPIRFSGASAFGVGSLGGSFYGPNEWVDVDDLVRLVAVTIEVARRWT